MDAALPAAVVATILSRLDVRSLLLAAAACRGLRACASHALAFLPSFHLLVRSSHALSLSSLSPVFVPMRLTRSSFPFAFLGDC
jgi:hypothetical protein